MHIKQKQHLNAEQSQRGKTANKISATDMHNYNEKHKHTQRLSSTHNTTISVVHRHAHSYLNT